ncbi:hypothetical protein HAX54_021823, partial [Datura stramonium]|nr:hypothetical protein [Datura stramonium]
GDQFKGLQQAAYHLLSIRPMEAITRGFVELVDLVVPHPEAKNPQLENVLPSKIGQCRQYFKHLRLVTRDRVLEILMLDLL